MKKFILLASLFSFTIKSGFTQEDEDPRTGTPQSANRFYYFEIPASINGSNLDPSPISNVTANFTESKISAKLGFPSLFRERDSSKYLGMTGFVQLNAKAANGLSTLYKTDNPPAEVGISGGVSYILNQKYWVYRNSEEHSSQRVLWLNVNGSVERANYNMLTLNGQYGSLIKKLTETNGSAFVSINYYFHSELNKHKWARCIISFGLGYAKTNDYSSLKKRTLEDGKLVYNADSSAYQTVVETTAGAIGELTISEGLASFVEFFVPIIKGKNSKKYGTLFFGNRITYFGVDKASKIINGTTGFYVALKDKKLDEKTPEKPAKDILSLSVTGQFNKLNDSKKEDYLKNNFSVVLQVAVPLRFN